MPIRVKKISTGQIGTLQDESKFDPNKFELIEGSTAPAQQAQPQTQTGGLSISPEIAALAPLLFDSKTAGGIAASFNVSESQRKEKEKKAEEESAAATKKSEEEQPVIGLSKVLNELKAGAKEVTITNILPGKLGLNSSLNRFEAKKKLAGQFLAKLVENGRLSDADRVFYQEQILNVKALGPQKPKEELIDSIINDVKTLSGVETPSEDKKKDETQGFGTNLIEDLKANIQGVASIPSVIKGGVEQASYIPELIRETQKGVVKPEDIGQAVVGGTKQVGGALVEPYADLLNDPFGTFNEKPITSTLALIPFFKVGKGIPSKVMSNLRRSASKAELISTVAPEMDQLAMAAAADIVPGTPKYLDTASRIYNSQFSVTARRGEQLRPLDVSREIVQHGLKPGNLQETRAIVNQVTGKEGMLSKITREVAGKIKGGVDIEDALTAPKKIIASSGLEDVVATRHKNVIDNIIGTKQTKGVFKLNGDAALDALRELEKRQSQWADVGYGKLTKNVDAQNISKMYRAAAENLSVSIEKLVGTEKLIDAFKTPENLKKIVNVSERLGQQFLKAKDLKDLRSIQSPFVRLGQMIDLTEASGGGSLSKSLTKVAGTGIGGAVGGIGGAAAGYALSPILEGIVQGNLPKLQTGAANILSGSQKLKLPAQLQKILQAN